VVPTSLSRVKIPARVAAPVLAILVLGSLAPAPAGWSASARLAPSLALVAGDPTTPIEVPFLTDPDPNNADLGFSLDVTGGPASNVSVTATGAGLSITPPSLNLGNVASSGHGSFAVSATTGGFHQLTFTVTADGGALASTTLDYVWAPTGALTVSPGASLRHTYFGTTGLYSENGTSFEDRSELLFLTRGIAYYGVPAAGLPKCQTGSTSATSGCLAYAYDPSTRLIQLGDAIGFVDNKGVHTIGLGITDYQGGEVFAHRDWTTQLAFPNAHNRYRGSWSWHYTNYCPDCFTFAMLTLRKDGTFVLLDNWRRKRTITGRYDVSHHGRLRLTGKSGAEVHTFSVLLSRKGKPDPGLGIALGYGKHKDTDVVFLEPKKK
jgi:hypothetical protein